MSFTDLSVGVMDGWSWDFGDLGSSGLRHPVHVFDTPGLYTVTLTVTGPGGVDVETKAAYVHVRPQRRAKAGSPASGVPPRPAPLSAPRLFRRFLELPVITDLLGGTVLR